MGDDSRFEVEAEGNGHLERKQLKSEPITIEVTGLEISARHGVLPVEKENAQPFVFDISIGLDGSPACDSDDITDALNYVTVCEAVEEVATANSFNLLEKLAAAAAEDLMSHFPSIQKLRLRVAKTKPHMDHRVRDVAVTVKRKRG